MRRVAATSLLILGALLGTGVVVSLLLTTSRSAITNPDARAGAATVKAPVSVTAGTSFTVTWDRKAFPTAQVDLNVCRRQACGTAVRTKNDGKETITAPRTPDTYYARMSSPDGHTRELSNKFQVKKAPNVEEDSGGSTDGGGGGGGGGGAPPPAFPPRIPNLPN